MLMPKEDIIRQCQKQNSTVLSFPERGPWGSNAYRGNCSGYVHAFLIWKYKVQKLAELFAGSGTGYDVSQDMGISYVGADLNPNPVRPGILCVDAVQDEVPDEFYDADFLFQHPPYGLEIGIPYAGSMYADPTGKLSGSDLGQMPWDIFIKTLNHITMKYYAAMAPGARMGILMGDVRRNGHFYSMLNDIVKPGEVEQVIIKMQHNASSNRNQDLSRIGNGKNPFVPLVHEYILILKKLGPYMLDFQLPIKKELDIRDSQCATWRDVVYGVLRKLGKQTRLSDIYAEIEGHQKAKTNPHWKEKVRQTLQVLKKSGKAEMVTFGVWQLAAA